jgi:hypothetical protein
MEADSPPLQTHRNRSGHHTRSIVVRCPLSPLALTSSRKALPSSVGPRFLCVLRCPYALPEEPPGDHSARRVDSLSDK